MSRWLELLLLIWAASVGWSGTAFAAAPSSYATGAVDVVGDTGAAAVALGVPDYRFVNDSGLGFGGTSTDVFDVGESVDLTFDAPLRNIPTQHDLIVSAFVGGLGATDNATVQVEVSTDGAVYTLVDVFDTEEARSRLQDFWWNDLEGVKHYFVDFGVVNNVTHVRLTNVAGTSEGLRLDAVEGLQPAVSALHAFEVRIVHWPPDPHQRFRLRIKNIAAPSGVPIREWRMTPSEGWLQDTPRLLVGVEGDFICVENCVYDNGPMIPFSRHAWSLDGISEAPPGVGLDPGRDAEHLKNYHFDTDRLPLEHLDLSGYTFRVTFADGVVHDFDYDADVFQKIGMLYQQNPYNSSTPTYSEPRPVDYYEYVEDTSVAPVPALGPLGLSVIGLSLIGLSLLAVGQSDRRGSA